MNAANTLNPLDAFASGAYPLGRSNAAATTIEEARHARSVALNKYLSAAAGGAVNFGSAVFEQIWRMVRALIAKVARVFGVEMNIPNEAPADQAALDAAAASFEGEESAVNGAVSEAEAALARQVEQIRAEPVNAMALVDAHGPTFLAFKLQDIGETIGKTEEWIQNKALALDAAVSEFAQKYDMSTGAAVHILKSESVSRSEKESRFPPEAMAILDELEVLEGNLVALQMRFCTYASLALRLSCEQGKPELQQASDALASRFANESMRKSIAELAVDESTTTSTEFLTKRGSLDVNSAKSESANVIPLVPKVSSPGLTPGGAAVVQKTSRSQRFGAVGHVGPDDAAPAVDASDFDEDAPSQAHRPRGG